MGAPRIKDKVLGYLSDHPGTVVWRKTLASDLGFSESQVTAAVNSAMRAAGDGIGSAGRFVEVVEQGHAWCWHPNGHQGSKRGPSRRLYEELATTHKGDVLVQSEEGAIYKLVEL